MNKLVAQIAHDVNNPVGNSLMYSQMLDEILNDLKNEYQNGEIEQAIEFNQNIKLALNSLTGILEAWVTGHHIAAGTHKFEKQALDPSVMLNKAIGETGIYTTRKRIKILKEWDESVPPVYTDLKVFQRILENMVMLMVIFATYEDTLRFIISDQGDKVGISMEDSYTDPRQALQDRFTGKEPWKDGEVLNEGVLKPAGYGLKFCGIALTELNAEPDVTPSELGGLKFSFKLPKAD